MPTMIDHRTYPHIIQAIMFATRSVMLLFRATSREMRDAVDQVIFHTAVLTPSPNPAFFHLCERNGRLRLPWIPVHAFWPSVLWPGVFQLTFPLPLPSLSHSQLAFVRVLTIVPGPYLSRKAFVFPSIKHLFHTLDSFSRLAELRWPSPPATSPAAYYIGAGANLHDLRPDLPVAGAYTYHLPVRPCVLDSIVVPVGVNRITVNFYYNRILFGQCPGSRGEFHLDLNLGSLRLDGNIGEVVFVLDLGDRTPLSKTAKGAASMGQQNLLGLFDALGVVLKRCLHANIVRPRQLSFILVGLEHLLDSEVGLDHRAGHARVTAAAVTRVLYPRTAEMRTPPSHSPTPSASSWGSPSPMPSIKPSTDSLALGFAVHHSNATFSPASVNTYPRSPPSSPSPSEVGGWRSQDLVGHVRVLSHAALHRRRMEQSP